MSKIQHTPVRPKGPRPVKARPLADLVEALRRHVRLLQRLAEQAFEAHDDDYLGEVANKLRLLAVEKKQNVPLLIKLMDECGIKAPLKLKPPASAGRAVSLSDFLDQTSLKVGDVRLSKGQLIEVVAEKYGGAHEDWEHPEYLTLLRKSQLRLKGYKPLPAALRSITTGVLTVADYVLPRLTPQVVAEAERRRREQP
jgi:hypothetical protein